tara:strand:- start:49 stop:423 length:375 start_codon:yes stop_codon:yes gene_type:complete
LKDILLVSFGSVLGVHLRFIIYRKFEQLKISKYLSILVVNTFASFLLGLFLSIMPRIIYDKYSYELILFFSIGFLGGLSTFASYVCDIFDCFLKSKFYRATRIFIFSFSSGIIALAFGLFIGNQ